MATNERRVELLSGNAVYSTLKDFLDRRVISNLPWSELAQVTVAGANIALIDSAMVTGNLAIGVGSSESDGIVATLLAGAVGTGSVNVTTDSRGNNTNMVSVRDSLTHDPVVTSGGFEVYGLIQAVSTASDGDAIAPNGSENTQISFVYIDGAGVITLTNVTGTFEFGRKVLTVLRNTPNYIQEGGNLAPDAIQGSVYANIERFFVVTTAFTNGEVIDISTGTGAGSGVTTVSGDAIATLGASAILFNADADTHVKEGGADSFKSVEAIWDSATTFHFNRVLDVGDRFSIQQLAVS